jgi:hypothetical protein
MAMVPDSEWRTPTLMVSSARTGVVDTTKAATMEVSNERMDNFIEFFPRVGWRGGA